MATRESDFLIKTDDGLVVKSIEDGKPVAVKMTAVERAVCRKACHETACPPCYELAARTSCFNEPEITACDECRETAEGLDIDIPALISEAAQEFRDSDDRLIFNPAESDHDKIMSFRAHVLSISMHSAQDLETEGTGNKLNMVLTALLRVASELAVTTSRIHFNRPPVAELWADSAMRALEASEANWTAAEKEAIAITEKADKLKEVGLSDLQDGQEVYLKFEGGAFVYAIASVAVFGTLRLVTFNRGPKEEPAKVMILEE